MDSRIVLRMSLLLIVALGAAGCGSDSDIDPNESERTRSIREKVQADMEEDRLKRFAPRIAHATESAAASPSAARITEVAGDADAGDIAGASNMTSLEIGETLYASNCSSCHGATGGSDGALAATLVPKPSQHNDGGYMNALSNDHIFKVIKEGGTAVGKSAMMAPWGTSLSDDEIWGLVEFVRTLAKPAYQGASLGGAEPADSDPSENEEPATESVES